MNNIIDILINALKNDGIRYEVAEHNEQFRFGRGLNAFYQNGAVYSVQCHSGSYGFNEGLCEIAIKKDGGGWCHPPIEERSEPSDFAHDDVVGWCDEKKVIYYHDYLVCGGELEGVEEPDPAFWDED